MALDERIFSGTWYHLARYGNHHNDIFSRDGPISWEFINRNCGYFSLNITITDVCSGEIQRNEGYATFSDHNFDITLFLPGGIFNLETYTLIYTDYVHYSLLGRKDDLIILSRSQTVENSEIPILISLSERYGYDGSSLLVNNSIAPYIISREKKTKIIETTPYMADIRKEDMKGGSKKILASTLL